MTPDVYCDFTIVNGTLNPVVVSPKSYKYQMYSWFPLGEGTVLASEMSAKDYILQFEKGVGDQDDSAGEYIGLNPQKAFVFIGGGSDQNSGHFLTCKTCDINERDTGLTIMAYVINVDTTPWRGLDFRTIQWNVKFSSPRAYLEDKKGYCLLADLDALKIPDARGIYDKVKQGVQLNTDERFDIFSSLIRNVNTDSA